MAWFKRNWPNSCAIEVKIRRGVAKEHQIKALQEVSRGVFGYKIPDMGRRNPFDSFILKNADAFLVICEGYTCEVENIKSKKRFRIFIKKD